MTGVLIMRELSKDLDTQGDFHGMQEAEAEGRSDPAASRGTAGVMSSTGSQEEAKKDAPP